MEKKKLFNLGKAPYILYLLPVVNAAIAKLGSLRKERKLVFEAEKDLELPVWREKAFPVWEKYAFKLGKVACI